MSLRCPGCGKTYEDRWRCCCGEPLRFEERPLPSVTDPTELDPREGLWTFSEFLPVERRVSLGEGYSPLVDAPAWDAAFKLEYVFPTGSFKDRGATTILSRALEVGADRVIVRVEGAREDVTDACVDAVEAGKGWYASHAWNPAFFAGTATMAHEIAHQRDWSAPDAVVMPLGHGTMFLGAYRGFRQLLDAGWIDRLPKLLGAQAAGYAPIAATLHDGADASSDNGIADGIRIREPVQKTAILGAIEESGGDAIAVSESDTATELDRLHEAGFYTESTCAVAPAALRTYRERGVVEPDDDVVVPLSGSGLKQ